MKKVKRMQKKKTGLSKDRRWELIQETRSHRWQELEVESSHCLTILVTTQEIRSHHWKNHHWKKPERILVTIQEIRSHRWQELEQAESSHCLISVTRQEIRNHRLLARTILGSPKGFQ